MAIYHLSVKTVSRSAGRSSTGAAAYRAAAKIVDERTGLVFDYTGKSGVVSCDLVLPEGAPVWAADRSALWNAAEHAETRKNSTVAREFEVALPFELSAAARRRLALDLAQEIVQRHGCAAEVAIHLPGKGGDNRNHHAHILLTTRRLTVSGLGEKTRELDDKITTGPALVEHWRRRFAELENERLSDAGLSVRVDHRSLAAQGIDRDPTRHLGPSAVGYERRTGRASKKRRDFDQVVAERLAQAKRAGELERQANALDEMILDLTMTISQAKAERDRKRQSVLRGTGVSIAELRERLERNKLKSSKVEPADQAQQSKEVPLFGAHEQRTPVARPRRDDDLAP